uniref:Cis-aconitate decarboxylase n=1 Tax=Latimeria chalumnae TaxID=7897 RepID=H3BDY9_LATCH
MININIQKTQNLFTFSCYLHKAAVEVLETPVPEETVTSSFGAFIQGIPMDQLSETVRSRSKQMILDNIGVGLVGSTTEVFEIALQYCQKTTKVADGLHMETYGCTYPVCSVYGRPGRKLSPVLAAFVNGVAVHAMDFDDTWHPATHPSGAVLPALLATAQMLPPNSKPSGLDFLLAFNVGIEVQGRLMRFSGEAHNIPNRFHPPSVVGTLGSAAATAKLLSLNQTQCRNALAIAASLAGAPMANAATQAKPLHIGNATRLGLEAALLASKGIEASSQILDYIPGCSGFSAFYSDYHPKALRYSVNDHKLLLEEQGVAFKRFPAHLGMHWVADAAISARNLLVSSIGSFSSSMIDKIVLRIPQSKYINRSFPETEHQARHSFQFNACTALLDGEVTIDSFNQSNLHRPSLQELLSKVVVEHPTDNEANFDKMYSEVILTLRNGNILKGRCDTFYGHWRNPLTRESLIKKFTTNTTYVLEQENTEKIIEMVENMEDLLDCSKLADCVQ